MNIIEKPLTKKQVIALVKENDPTSYYIKVYVSLSLNEIINAGGMEDFNELIDGRIGVSLTDISYKAVGHVQVQNILDEGRVVVEVYGCAMDFLEG